MYTYDQYDHTLVRQRVEQFRDQVERRISGKLSEDEFKPLRLRNGLYLQRHAYMLRVAIPYGLLSADQLRMLAFIAREYDRGYGHFTTRQNIQYNWPELEDVPDILQHLALVEMHAIQTSGNCIRNITADHLAGVAADELEDPRPYCEILRQWSTLHPEFSWLPRKFKIAVTGASEDRAAVLLHDIGLRLVRDARGEVGFRVYVGGGMGRTPVIGKLLREFLPRKHLLSYVEAVLRIYNLLGRRDNIHKARVKILVNAVGIDAFRDEVEREWQRIANDGLQLEEHDIAAMQRYFDPPVYERLAADNTGVKRHLRGSPEFALWYKRNTSAHKVPGYRVVNVSLKAPGVPPGDATDAQMDAVADLAERYSFSRIRVTHEQNLVLADVKQSDLYALWHGLVAHQLATPNIGTLNDMICCPGLDFCSLANAGSIPIAKQINERFDDLDYLYDLGDIKLKMSGCMNACGHHHVGDIGILGVEKHGEEWYQVTLGGAAGNQAALGDRLGKSVAKQHVAETIERVLHVYLDNRTESEQFADTYRRIGLRPFKEYVYADHSRPSHRRRRVAA